MTWRPRQLDHPQPRGGPMSARTKVSTTGGFLMLLLLAGALVPRAVTGQDRDDLLESVRRGDADALRALLAGGADPDAAQGDGLTALHLAAERGDAGLVRTLLDGGADPRARSRLGAYTPLHLAAGAGHAGVVRALLA